MSASQWFTSASFAVRSLIFLAWLRRLAGDPN
jgi:hypothetical protein